MARVTLPSAADAPVIDIAAPLGPQKSGIYLVKIDEWCPPNQGNNGYLAKCHVAQGMLDFGPDNKAFFNTEYTGQSVWVYVNPPTDSDPGKFKKQLGVFKSSLLAMGFPDTFVHGGGSIDLDDPTEGGTIPNNAIVGRTMCVLYEPPLLGYVTQGSDGKTYACKQRVLAVIPSRFAIFKGGDKPQYQNHLGNPNVMKSSDAAGGGGFGGGAAGFGKSNGASGGGFNPNAGAAAAATPDPTQAQAAQSAQSAPVADPWAVTA